MIWHQYYMLLAIHYFLSVSPVVSRLTIYRRPQVRILRQLVGLPNDYRPFQTFRVVFSKNLSFSRIKPIFWEFVLLKVDNAEAHARGFASL